MEVASIREFPDTAVGTAIDGRPAVLASVQCPDYREFLSANYSIVTRVVRQVAHRRGLNIDQADELRSAVHLKLVENEYAVLSAFAGRSNLATYLLRVVDRVFLDSKTAESGKFRPSAKARRFGPIAIRLERMVVRDRIPFDEACEILRNNHGAQQSRRELERMRSKFPRRALRPVHCSLDEAERFLLAVQGPKEMDHHPYAAQIVRWRIGTALRHLSDTERLLLSLRFRDGWTVARIARSLRVDQKLLYRQFDRIFARLRTAAVDDAPVRGVAGSRARARSRIPC